MGRRPIEEVMDEALQRLLDGESAEAIVARYPEYAGELGPMLFAARTLKQLPQPQLPQASLATMVARAQAQAASDRKTTPIIVPPDGVDREVAASETERVIAPQSVTGMALPPNRKASLAERIAAWMRPPGLLSRAPAALALALILLLGIYAASMLVAQPQPPVLTVPTVSSRFTLDGTIEQMASDSWLVGGNPIYLDAKTVISGTPSVGSQAHIEGEIGAGNRRLAQSIMITAPSGTATVAISIVATAKVDNGPTMPPSTVTITPRIVATGTVQATVVAPPGGTLVPAPSGTSLSVRPGTATTRPGPPVQVTRLKPPTAIAVVPTRVTPAQPTATGQPSSTSTSAPQLPATSTTEPAPTDTRTPEPGPSSTATATEVGPPTAIPSQTPEPEPTGEPTGEPSETPAPRPSATARPTEPPEPEGSPTPLPTAPGPSSTPTTAPTATGVMPTATPVVPTATPTVAPPASPTRTEEPHETETAEPTGTGEPEATGTAQPSETMQPTRTGEPEETGTSEPTGEPDDTRTPEPTQGAGR